MTHQHWTRREFLVTTAAALAVSPIVGAAGRCRAAAGPMIGSAPSATAVVARKSRRVQCRSVIVVLLSP